MQDIQRVAERVQRHTRQDMQVKTRHARHTKSTVESAETEAEAEAEGKNERQKDSVI